MKKLLLLIILLFCLTIPSCDTFPFYPNIEPKSISSDSIINPQINIIIDSTETTITDTIYIDIFI